MRKRKPLIVITPDSKPAWDSGTALDNICRKISLYLNFSNLFRTGVFKYVFGIGNNGLVDDGSRHCIGKLKTAGES